MLHAPERAVIALAGRQDGVITHGQCLRLGLSADQVHRRVAGGGWRRLHRGVYALGPAALSHIGRYLAAVFGSGPDAVLGYRSGAGLWSVQPHHGGPVHTVAGLGRGHRRGLVVHRTRRWEPGMRTVRFGVPVTTLARTLVDLAEVASQTEVETAIRTAERLHDFDRALLLPLPGRHGTPRLVPPARFFRGDLEPLLAPVLRRHGLPEPDEYNAKWATYELDAVWWDAGVVLEIDDWDTHRHREAFVRDRRRSRRLQAAGYRAIQATYEDLTVDAHRFAAELRVLLGVLPQRGGRG